MQTTWLQSLFNRPIFRDHTGSAKTSKEHLWGLLRQDFVTDRTPFQSPNQQRQSTEGISTVQSTELK